MTASVPRLTRRISGCLLIFSRPRCRRRSYRTRARALMWGGAAPTLLRFRLDPFAEVRRAACRSLAAPPSPAPASSLCRPACHVLHPAHLPRRSCDRRRLAHADHDYSPGSPYLYLHAWYTGLSLSAPLYTRPLSPSSLLSLLLSLSPSLPHNTESASAKQQQQPQHQRPQHQRKGK